MIFNQKQADFLKKELGIVFEPDKNIEMTFDEWGKIQDDVFEIEVDETMAAGNHNPLNERGEIAVSIVSMVYKH